MSRRKRHSRVDSRKPILALKSSWMNERCCPELLEYDHHSVASVVKNIDEQESRIRKLESNIATDSKVYFLTNLYNMEVERVRFFLRAYLRTRIVKIERHAFFLHENEEYHSRMSESEQAYLNTFFNLVKQSVHVSCLDAMPHMLRGLTDEKEKDVSMIPRPNLGVTIFARVKEDLGTFQMEAGGADEPTIDLQANDLFVVPYSYIRSLVSRKRVQLV